MNILLINLTRFGDLLQTQAAITDLTRQGHRVGVVCLENFAGVAGLLSYVSHVAALPGAAFLTALAPKEKTDSADIIEEGSLSQRALDGVIRWPEALSQLAAWRNTLAAEFPVDVVCNLTPTLSARLLARFLAGTKPCTGFAVDDHGFGYSSNRWAAFLQGASAARGVSPFNVVDIFRMVARRADEAGDGTHKQYGLPGDAGLQRPDAELISRMYTLLLKQAPEGCKGFVALQPGASEDRRRWPVGHFVELGERLWDEERLCPVLLGSKAEQHLARRYRDAAEHPSISLCGKTSLTELAAALCSMRLLITNDTGTMHLAVGLNVPVLAVFLATAQPFDTGPYREGSCSVEPDLPCHPCPFGKPCLHEEMCRRAVTPAFMAYSALGYLRTGRWPEVAGGGPQAEYGAGFGSGRLWVSEYDEKGFMTLRSLSGHGREERAQWLLLLRRALSQFIDRDPECPFVFSLPGKPLLLAKEIRDEAAEELETISALMHLLQQQGKALLMRPLPQMQEKFLGTWQRVHAALSTSPRLSALAVIWLEETQAEGQDLPCVLRIAEHFSVLLRGMFESVFV